jgi:hypothetical protein
MKSLKQHLVLAEYAAVNPVPGDVFDIAVTTDQLIETVVSELMPDGSIIIELDTAAVKIMESAGMVFEDSNMPVANDSASPIKGSSKMSGSTDGFMSPINGSAFAPYDRRHDPREWFRHDLDDQEDDDGLEVHTHSIVTMNGTGYDERDGIAEAKYHGKTVPLGKPMAGDVKKSKVYVKDPKTGNVKKVNFGDPNMRIKKSSPAHRKSFRARHHCDNPGPRTKARYWSCRAW